MKLEVGNGVYNTVGLHRCRSANPFCAMA